MRMREVDPVTNDWFMGRGLQNYKSGNDAIGQDAKSKVLMFFGECFFAATEGVDWLNFIGSKESVRELSFQIRKMLLQVEGVVGVPDISINLDRKTRHLDMSYTLDTIFSRSIKYQISTALVTQYA